MAGSAAGGATIMRMDRQPHPHPVARVSAALALAFATGFAAAPAFAADCLPKVEGAWIRMPPAGLPMMAGYARISNPCRGPLAIVAAHSGAFADTSLHETRVEDGMSRMRATPALRLAPGGSAMLEPGGFHLMLMRPVKPLRAGDRVSIEFTLEDGRRFSVPFDARPIAGP